MLGPLKWRENRARLRRFSRQIRFVLENCFSVVLRQFKSENNTCFVTFKDMPFKKGDLNNPSFKQKRRSTKISPTSSRENRGKPFSPRLRAAVLQRIKSGIDVNTALADACVRDKNAAKRWKDLLQDTGNVTPLKRSGGRPRKVAKGSPEEKLLERLADKDPYCSTEIIACRLLNRTEIEISSRTVRRQLYKRADDRFSYKTPNTSCSEVNLERVLDMQMGYLDGMHSAIAQGLCSEDEFYFADECPIFIGVLPRKGRCRKGEQLYGRAPYRPRKFTLHSAIGPRGYYKVWLSENNANDAEVRHFVLDNIRSPQHAPSLGGPPLPLTIPPHSFFIWDRLGRAGRCLNPSKQHYNPEIHQQFRQAKIQVVMLPPKGHEANPSELFQGNIQASVKRWRAPGQAADESGPRDFYEAQKAVSDALDRLRFSCKAFRGWYAARATGCHLRLRWEKDRVAKRVSRRRTVEESEIYQWPRKL